MSRPCRHITKYGSFHIPRCAVSAGVLKTLLLYAMRANSPERHVPSVLASVPRWRTGHIPVATSSHDVSITRRVSEPLHSPWSCSLPTVQPNVSIEVHTMFPPRSVLATKPPDLTSCPLNPDKLIHFVQVHRILHENPAPTHLGSEQLPLANVEVELFSDEFSQGKANVAEFSISVSCCLQLCRIGTSCHSGQLATVPADHIDWPHQ